MVDILRDILMVLVVFGVIIFVVALPEVRIIIGNLIYHYKPKWYINYRERFGPPLTEDEQKIVNQMKEAGLI